MLLPTGTTSNEPLHNELKRWFLGQSMMPALFKIKLATFKLVKLLSHNSALYWPTTTQLPQNEVLHRVVMALDLWTQRLWEQWCSQMEGDQEIMKSHTGFELERDLFRGRLEDWRAEQGTKSIIHRKLSDAISH